LGLRGSAWLRYAACAVVHTQAPTTILNGTVAFAGRRDFCQTGDKGCYDAPPNERIRPRFSFDETGAGISGRKHVPHHGSLAVGGYEYVVDY